MAEDNAGFLGRWARRKHDALQGKPLPVATPLPSGPVAPQSPPGVAQAPEPPEKLLTLDDVKQLTRDSDFKPFMAGNVGPEVRNAAMKKLFADPHFNVMDGLDIYIDDYSKSDPIPESMLRQMASAKFLKLFDDEEEAEKQALADASTRESANNPTDETVAQSCEHPDMVRPDIPDSTQPVSAPPAVDAGVSPQNHAHTDLRLQPDHAPSAPGAGRGTA
ncbi:DUF3306 domain-containing protein [Polaromonas sp.]|uniref:DUF3306 domain-containing protein n=1 Tax=Polaromonas sp. TaxID=1869339 RepID=UPI00286B53DA|nr:DUF3306 domain-containing protein [Polaromonas sp.]